LGVSASRRQGPRDLGGQPSTPQATPSKEAPHSLRELGRVSKSWCAAWAQLAPHKHPKQPPKSPPKEAPHSLRELGRVPK
jgi:hypothetical protein